MAVWHDGHVKDTSLDLTYEYGVGAVELDFTWWVEARLADGRTVWLKDPSGFTGMDRFG